MKLLTQLAPWISGMPYVSSHVSLGRAHIVDMCVADLMCSSTQC